jgi:hypothetical protein
MKVRQLIKHLIDMDLDADIFNLWDGEPRSSIECVYMSKSGICITADAGEIAYSNSGRPVDAPDEDEDPYWRTSISPFKN